jgi:hypothetical protein
MTVKFSTTHYLGLGRYRKKVLQNQGLANAPPPEFVMQLSKLGQGHAIKSGNSDQRNGREQCLHGDTH